MEEVKVECEGCGRLVPKYDLNRYGDCCRCRAEERKKEMGVGDINT